MADLYDIAIGDLGLKRQEFERMSWGEFHCRVRGWMRKQEELWRHTRVLAYYAGIPNLKKGTTPEKIVPLPSDKEGKNYERMTKQRFKELKEKWLNAN